MASVLPIFDLSLLWTKTRSQLDPSREAQYSDLGDTIKVEPMCEHLLGF